MYRIWAREWVQSNIHFCKRLLLVTGSDTSVNGFCVFLCMGRCNNLGPLKFFPEISLTKRFVFPKH